jgi:programmed cell death protein 5
VKCQRKNLKNCAKETFGLTTEMAEEQQKAQMEQQLELQKQAILKSILTPEARQRLTNLKLVKPEFTAQLRVAA